MEHRLLEKNIADIYSEFATTGDRYDFWEKLLLEAVAYVRCDGATIYTVEENMLYFKIVKTISKDFFVNVGKDPSQQENFSPLPMNLQNACAYCAMQKRVVCIDDVYDSNYDFAGAKNYDQKNQYKTVSMLMYPIVNQQDVVVAVVQLINALDEQGKITTFGMHYQEGMETIFGNAGDSLEK